MDENETSIKIKDPNKKIYVPEVKPTVFRGYGLTFNY